MATGGCAEVNERRAPEETLSLVERRIAAAVASLDGLRAVAADIARIADLVHERVSRGATIYTAGNGGSAAEAMHFAEELIGRYRRDRRPLPAVCLCADPTALTCIANDFGYERVFARQCEALLRESDVLVLFSTSGRSPNLLAAAQAGRAKRALVLGILGGSGGALREQCDESLVVGATDSASIQEGHQVLLHILCERLDVLGR